MVHLTKQLPDKPNTLSPILGVHIKVKGDNSTSLLSVLHIQLYALNTYHTHKNIKM